MLKKWEIENFKSFRKKTPIEFAPITVFAGANSSGKSTIIQSVLLIKQTLQYGSPAKPITLNGPLLKLGTFSDIKNHNNNSEPHIAFSWQLNADEPSHKGQYNYWYKGPILKEISCSIKIDSQATNKEERDVAHYLQKENLDLQPSLAYVSFNSVSVGASDTDPEQDEMHKAFITAQRPIKPILSPRPREIYGSSVEREDLLYEIKDIDIESEEEAKERRADANLVGVGTYYFMPGEIRINYDSAKENARRITEIIVNLSRTRKTGTRFSREYADVKIPIAAQRIIQNQLKSFLVNQRHLLEDESMDSLGNHDLSFSEFSNEFNSLIKRIPSYWRREKDLSINLREIQPALENILQKSFDQKMSTMDVDVDQVTISRMMIEEFFKSSVRYLGPLRDEPKPIYPLEVVGSPTEVGYRGEHTAAILDLNGGVNITYTPSSEFSSERNEVNISALRVDTATLHDAVVDWLKYLGVAEEVTTRDQGKFGHQLQVSTSGINKSHDLTNVGVGVSQVLPIIVMALLADSPSVLIFEQPELHLHPKVQARLADFFLSMALQGKQCILETHSEYLIERLRRRIAEAEGDALSSTIKIYFVEQNKGETICRPVQISKYGAIQDWPRDFFDQSGIETEEILTAAMKKREVENRREKK